MPSPDPATQETSQPETKPQSTWTSLLPRNMGYKGRALTAYVAILFIGASTLSIASFFQPPHDPHYYEKVTFMAKLILDGREFNHDEAHWIFKEPWKTSLLPVAQGFFPGLDANAIASKFQDNLLLRLPDDVVLDLKLKAEPGKRFAGNPRFVAAANQIKACLMEHKAFTYREAWWYHNPFFAAAGIVSETFEGDPKPIVEALFSCNVKWAGTYVKKL